MRYSELKIVQRIRDCVITDIEGGNKFDDTHTITYDIFSNGNKVGWSFHVIYPKSWNCEIDEDIFKISSFPQLAEINEHNLQLSLF